MKKDSPLDLNSLLNDFAIRCFRDIGDGDYIAARMACRTSLVAQYLWASQQMVEKYLKCILLLNRISSKNVKHDLGLAISKINDSDKVMLDLTSGTKTFIDYLDTFGQYRYLEISNYALGRDIVTLDRVAWELRRYCTLSSIPLKSKLQQGVIPPKIRLPSGCLEKIIDNEKNPAREPLLWQNAFFGKRARKKVKLNHWLSATNSPLYLHPEILDEVNKYIFLPKDVIAAYRTMERSLQ